MLPARAIVVLVSSSAGPAALGLSRYRSRAEAEPPVDRLAELLSRRCASMWANQVSACGSCRLKVLSREDRPSDRSKPRPQLLGHKQSAGSGRRLREAVRMLRRNAAPGIPWDWAG